MTLEKESFDSNWDYTGKQRVFNRIMSRIGEQALPGAPHVEQYFQNLHRRNVSVHTLKTAFTTIQGFLSFLQKPPAPPPKPPNSQTPISEIADYHNGINGLDT